MATIARLASARVTNFGCFRDSGDVPIDGVTALLAENENGKTTFLRALAWWSERGTEFDDEDRWDGAPADAVLDAVSLTFEVNDELRQALIGAGVNKPPRLMRMVADTENTYRIENPSTGERLEATKGPLRYDVAKTALAAGLREHEARLSEAASLAAALEAALPGGGVAETAIAGVRAQVVPFLSAEEQEQLNTRLDEMELAIETPGELTTPSINTLVEPFLPQLLYFDDLVDFVQDSISYAEVTADPGRHRTMINLATIAGIDLLQVASATPHQRLNYS